MNKFIGFLICCFFLGMTWACDDDDEVKTGNLPAVSLGSKEFKTLENITPFRIPVVLSVPATQQVTVTGFIKSETGAKEGVDYTFVSREIVIPEGKSSGYFEVEITDYPEYKPDREFEFEIVGVKGAKLITPDACKVIIMSNEGLPVLGFATTLMSVSEEMQQLEIQVQTDRVWDEAVPFKLRILSDKSTAVYGEHYVVDTTQLYTISAGDTSLVIPVTIIDNIEQNEDRYFEIEIDENQNSVLSEVYRNMKVTILDDEEPVYVCFDKTSLSAMESEGPVWLPVRIKGNSRIPVKVTLELRGGTAVEGTDFTFEQCELNFPVGTLLDSVRIDFIDNQIYDLDRTLQIGFATVEGAGLASSDTLATITIENDDINPSALYEDMLGEYNLTLTKLDSKNDPTKIVKTTATLSSGDTPEEEDKNYQTIFIVKFTSSDIAYGNEIKLKIGIDIATGEMQVITGDYLGISLGYSGDYGNCDLRMTLNNAEEGYHAGSMSMTHNINYTVLTSEPDVPIYGQLVRIADGNAFSTYDSNTKFANLVFTKIK